MAKETCTICGAGVCKICSLVVLVAGILFLLQDLAVWGFWNISWYTVVLVLIGLGGLIGKK